LTCDEQALDRQRWHSRGLSANSFNQDGRLTQYGDGSRNSEEEVTRMKFRPLHDRVLVRRVEAEEKTAGGIIIPDTAKEKPQEGEVVAAGSGTRGEDGTITPLDVKTGDKILFGKWSGTEVRLDGEDLLIMKESDILGIVG
jgi:chaperonin GroES